MVKTPVGKAIDEKISTNGQLFVKFINIFAVKILCYVYDIFVRVCSLLRP